MNVAKIRHAIALALLVSLLFTTIWVGLFVKQTSHWDAQEWFHAFCLGQTILLTACAVYGPGAFLARMPFVVAWSLAIGFALARLNLISAAGRSSLAAGTILVVAGTTASLIVFASYRWITKATVRYRHLSYGHASRWNGQISLRAMLILTAAFAVTSVVARGATGARADPFGTEHDIAILHAYLGFFNCLRAAPALLVVFRPSWKIGLVVLFFLLMTWAEPLLLERAAPFILEDASLIQPTPPDAILAQWSRALLFNAQTLVATVAYALLARVAGFRMVLPHQSNNKKPNPSGQPEVEAGCVQD